MKITSQFYEKYFSFLSWRLFFSLSPRPRKTFVHFNLFLTWIQTMASQLSLQACPGASSGLLETSSFQQNNNAGQQVWMFACIYVRRGSCWKELQEMNFQDGVLLRGSVSWPAMRVQIFNSPAAILERGFSMFPKWAICSLQIHALHNVDSNKAIKPCGNLTREIFKSLRWATPACQWTNIKC